MQRRRDRGAGEEALRCTHPYIHLPSRPASTAASTAAELAKAPCITLQQSPLPLLLPLSLPIPHHLSAHKQPRETTGSAALREEVERFEELKRGVREVEEDNRVSREARPPRTLGPFKTRAAL